MVGAKAQGRRIEEALKPRAEEREKAGKSADGSAGGRGRKKKPSSDSDEGFAESENDRRTDTLAAEAVGMKRDRYVKARAVMEAVKRGGDRKSNSHRESLNGWQKMELRKREIRTALALRKMDPKRYTEAVLAQMFGPG